jgi:hypothetical protein
MLDCNSNWRTPIPLRAGSFARRFFPLVAVVLGFSACGTVPEIPAPRPTASSFSFMGDGDTVLGNAGVFQWIPGRPVTVGVDIFVFEILDHVGEQAYSIMLSGERVRFPQITIQIATGLPTGERDTGYWLHVECGQSYRWHVRQMEGLNLSPWSTEWTFLVAPAPRVAPVLTGPPDGAEIRGGSLTWSEVPGEYGVLYAFRIKERPDSDVRGLVPVELTSFGPLERQNFFTLIAGHTYYWQAMAFQMSGCSGPWSASRRFIWRGPDIIADSDSLPPGDMERPEPVCPMEPCETATRAGSSPAATATPTRSAIPTATVLILSPSPTPPTTAIPTDTPHPGPVCSDYANDPAKCKSAGCYWWSNSTCQANPEPPPTPDCSAYNTQATCENAQCTWDDIKRTCHA